MAQIATTFEQSQLLLEIGVPAETADMRWDRDTVGVGSEDDIATYDLRVGGYCGTYEIPAWSLSSLLGLLPRLLKSKDSERYYMLDMKLASLTVFEYIGNAGETLWSVQQLDMFEAAIAAIQWLIREKYQLNITRQ
jgi:hypothetical protein